MEHRTSVLRRTKVIMNLDLTEEQKLIQDTARDFAVTELEPVAAELDRGNDARFL